MAVTGKILVSDIIDAVTRAAIAEDHQYEELSRSADGGHNSLHYVLCLQIYHLMHLAICRKKTKREKIVIGLNQAASMIELYKNTLNSTDKTKSLRPEAEALRAEVEAITAASTAEQLSLQSSTLPDDIVSSILCYTWKKTTNLEAQNHTDFPEIKTILRNAGRNFS